MTEHLFCWCGYPITVEDVPTIEGERQVYTDGKTGAVIEECPACHDSPLTVQRLFREPASIGLENEPLLGGN
ncbi:MAG TPA: hypothetical protein VM537_26700 [Anaerolineae bacterium]|nr:hypothetical protein [Anaerolineae bacterium]